MALTECVNGHLYNSDQYASCPYCSGNMNRVEFDNGIGKTVGLNAPSVSDSEIGATVAPSGYKSSKAEDSDVGKTVAVLQKSLKLEPVAGWLVCIEGKNKGKDFRLEARNNSIGRSEKMDICIKDDETISRENHARIAYDPKHNKFHLIPGENTNNTYVNDEPVYVPAELNAEDVIEIGESKFMFIPFCTERFNWQDGITKGE